MKITGVIRTFHEMPGCVAAAVSADNLREMETVSEETDGHGMVTTTIQGERIRSVIASMDDYLANITVAEEICKRSLTSADQDTEKRREAL
jgi:hypothetical protein